MLSCFCHRIDLGHLIQSTVVQRYNDLDKFLPGQLASLKTVAWWNNGTIENIFTCLCFGQCHIAQRFIIIIDAQPSTVRTVEIVITSLNHLAAKTDLQN